MAFDVPEGFRVIPASNYCRAVTDGTHDSPKEVPHGKLLITSKNIKGGRIQKSGSYTISVADYEQIVRRSRVDRWDIIFTMIGTVGELALVDEPTPDFAIKNVGLFKSRDRLSAKWMYYFMCSPIAKEELEKRKKGSTQQYISLGDLRTFPILEPDDEAHKRAAVELLSGLDARIDLLRQTNTTLESIAQALFKSWFIDFDPVRAKQAGREPEGMDAATAALFPAEFEESALGLIPMGWESANFGALLRESSTRVGIREALVLSAIQSGELVPSGDHFNKRVHSEDIGKYKAVHPFAFAYNPSRINIGSIGLNESDALGAVSPIYVVLEAVSRPSAYYIWHQLRTSAVKQWIQTLSSGTVRQSLSCKDFCSIPFVNPPVALLHAFYEMRLSLYESVGHYKQRIRNLSALRDELLPRLISGKLRLPEAQEQLEDALA